MRENNLIEVKGTKISVTQVNNEKFISLTDMLHAKDGDFFISDWLRNRNTVEFLGIWERVNNPNFNYGGFATIRNQAGLNRYKISVKEWVSATVKDIELAITKLRYDDYISLTDIARYRDTDRTDYILQNWMRTRSTIEFLGLWEQLNNPHFKPIEFDGFKTQAGSNSFSLTPKRWIESTNAIMYKLKFNELGF